MLFHLYSENSFSILAIKMRKPFWNSIVDYFIAYLGKKKILVMNNQKILINFLNIDSNRHDVKCRKFHMALCHISLLIVVKWYLIFFLLFCSLSYFNRCLISLLNVSCFSSFVGINFSKRFSVRMMCQVMMACLFCWTLIPSGTLLPFHLSS